MRPTSLFLLGAAGLTSLVSGQATETLTATATVSTITRETTIFPDPVTPTTTVVTTVVATDGAGSHAAGLEGPLVGLVAFLMAAGLM